MNTNYDAIVIGCGGMGSATVYELARRGLRVLGLEQFPLVHNRGSSHGRSRVIRTAYYEQPAYVPILRHAWQRWYDLEQLLGRHLLTECGCLSIGPSGGELITGVLQAARYHSLVVQKVDRAELQRRYPFQVPDGYEGVHETHAGFLMVEDCVRAYLDAAMSFGANLQADETVARWTHDGKRFQVETNRGRYECPKLVITAGAWATKLLAGIGVPLTVMRQVMNWFQPKEPMHFRRDRFPVFLYETAENAFYGLPMIDQLGVKISRHYGEPELPSPDAMNWETGTADEAAVRPFLDRYLPNEFAGCSYQQACMYTLTPDRHFVIDRHPKNPDLIFAGGFSGHGFKFASVVGEILADLTLTGSTLQPIELFRANRFVGIL
jgi:sarcosine oxidase